MVEQRAKVVLKPVCSRSKTPCCTNY